MRREARRISLPGSFAGVRARMAPRLRMPEAMNHLTNSLRTASLTLLVSCLLLPAVASAAPKPSTTWKEVPLDGEQEIFSALPAEFNSMQSNVAGDADTTAERGLHNKPLTTVRAELKVLDGIADPYRQGF